MPRNININIDMDVSRTAESINDFLYEIFSRGITAIDQSVLIFRQDRYSFSFHVPAVVSTHDCSPQSLKIE